MELFSVFHFFAIWFPRASHFAYCPESWQLKMVNSKPKKRAYMDIEDRFDNIDSSDGSEKASDSEEDVNRESSHLVITEKLLNEWKKKIVTPNQAIIHDIINGFAVAVQQMNNNRTEKTAVKSSTIFNDLVKLCLTKIAPALQTFLNLAKIQDIRKAVKPKSAKWTQVRADVQIYLYSLLEMINCIAESSMLDIILKHIHKMVLYYAMFNKLSKSLMKKMITIWGSSEDTSRVLAFLCINKLVTMSPSKMLEPCMKKMYIEYVKNCKFTSPTLLPMIKFMQQSFVEILKIDENTTYQHAFIYIRQQAIHLRNALTVKKKDLCQAVYNWQYIRCLELWSLLVSSMPGSTVFEHLIYPLVQIITGTIKLIPSVTYFPLRFHCIAMLNSISASTGKFTPILPFIIETLEEVDLNKKHGKISLKPLGFTCMLKLSNAQVQEKAFKDALIDQVYEHLLVHLNIYANSVGFPELVFPMQVRLKEIIKKCKVANYTKQLKQILDKAEDNSNFITERRNSLSVKLADSQAIAAWERQCKESNPPVSKYYQTWKKLREREIMHQIAAKDTIIGHDNFQDIKAKKDILPKASEKDREEFSKLFESDDENTFADIFNINVKKLKEEGAKEKTQSKNEKERTNKKKKLKKLDKKHGSGNILKEAKSKEEGPSKKKKLKITK